MNAAATARGSRFRLVWLLLATASAAALTDYLFDLNGGPMVVGWRFGLFAAAWSTVLLAWRQHRPYLRRWSGGLTFLVIIAEIITVSAVRNHFFSCQPSSFSSATLPAVHAYAPAAPRKAVPDSVALDQSNAFLSAIENNDLAGVEKLLADGDDPDVVVWGDEDTAFGDYVPAHAGRTESETPLHRAVVKGNRQIAALLLGSGASANSGDPSPLAEAADRDDTPMMRLLLRHGASVCDDTTGNSRVLWDAVLHGKTEVVDCLLRAGASPLTAEDSPTNSDRAWSVLHLARSTGNKAIVQRLKQAGATQ